MNIYLKHKKKYRALKFENNTPHEFNLQKSEITRTDGHAQ